MRFDLKGAQEVVDAALDAGVTLFETADISSVIVGATSAGQVRTNVAADDGSRI